MHAPSFTYRTTAAVQAPIPQQSHFLLAALEGFHDRVSLGPEAVQTTDSITGYYPVVLKHRKF